VRDVGPQHPGVVRDTLCQSLYMDVTLGNITGIFRQRRLRGGGADRALYRASQHGDAFSE
jgi:hypothetical protein